MDSWKERPRNPEPLDLNWYTSFRSRLIAACGRDRLGICTAAWAIQVASGDDEIGSMKLVLRAEKRGDVGSLVPNAIRVLHGKSPEAELDAWVYDFTDLIIGQNTRTFMGNDPRGGPPIPIDRWAYRDVGFIDADLRSWLIKSNVPNAINLKTDVFNEDTYEYAHNFYVNLAKELDKKKWGGMNWLPHQVLGVGRMVMQKMLGTGPIYPSDIIPDGRGTPS